MRPPEIVARFCRQIDEAKALLEASSATLGTAAKHHYQAELAADDKERAIGKGTMELRKMGRPAVPARHQRRPAPAPPREALPDLWPG